MLPLLIALSAHGADAWLDDEDVRFGGVQAELPATSAPELWHGGARAELNGVVALEAQLHSLGARPDQTVLISAQLDWGALDRSAPAGELRFTGTGLTVRSRRLSDGAVLQEGTVVDEHGSYDLSDAKQRDRLCTRAAAGELGALSLHTWTPPSSDEPRAPGFLMVQGDSRTAMVDLEPGESATVVELVGGPDGKRPPRVRRALRVERGDRVITLTEGDLISRVCLDF